MGWEEGAGVGVSLPPGWFGPEEIPNLQALVRPFLLACGEQSALAGFSMAPFPSSA